MQKSVFTIETPERCEDCPCIGISAGCHVGYCKLAGKINSDYHVKIIPDWCPLKPLPEKKEYIVPIDNVESQKDIIAVGWNACLREITETSDKSKR
nr:MAG TPA: hypothetical protein [Caudoviricetes sp.]